MHGLGGGRAPALQVVRWVEPQSVAREYPDRLEVLNPGGLFGPLSVADLGEPGRVATRNPHLVRLVSELTEDGSERRLCENRGTGVAVMIERLRDAGMAPPEFDDKLLRFRVCFENHTLFDADTLRWVQSRLGERGSEAQRRVLAWLRHTEVGLDNPTYRRLTAVDSRVATRELGELVDLGLLERTGTRRWSRYRLRIDEATLAAAEPSNVPERADRSGDIVRLLELSGPLSREDIAQRLGLSASAVGYWLRRLRAAGRVDTTTAHARSKKTRYVLATSGR